VGRPGSLRKQEFILNGGHIGMLFQILGHKQITVTKRFCAVWSTEELKGEHDRFSLVSCLNGGVSEETGMGR